MKVVFIAGTVQQAEAATLIAPLLKEQGAEVLCVSLELFHQLPVQMSKHSDCEFVVAHLPKVLQKANKSLRYAYGICQLPKFLEKLFRENEVRVVVFGNDRIMLHRWLIKYIQRLDISVILLQDGIIFDAKAKQEYSTSLSTYLIRQIEQVTGLPILPIEYGQGGCDYLFVIGEQSKELFIHRSVSPERIIITGLPRLDVLNEFYKSRNSKRSALRERLRVPENRPVALWLTQPFLRWNLISKEEHEQFVINFCESILEFLQSDGELWIKFHPSDQMDLYIPMLQSMLSGFMKNKQVWICSSESTHELILASDLVLGVHSTALLEASILSVQTVFLDLLSSARVPGIFKDYNVGKIVSSWIQLKKILLECIVSTKDVIGNTTGASSLLFVDGNASMRIAKLISTLAVET